MIWTIIVLSVLALIILYVLVTYNSFVKKNNQIEEAYATMDVCLKKRWDLIPNLVETVKGYAKHEQATLESIIKLRNHSYSDLSYTDKMNANEQLTQGINRLLAVAENYPELKANNNFMDLGRQLEDLNNEIANSRKYYNAVVKTYNNSVQMFPSNLVAGIFNFDKKQMFEINEEERDNVKVEF